MTITQILLDICMPIAAIFIMYISNKRLDRSRDMQSRALNHLDEALRARTDILFASKELERLAHILAELARIAPKLMDPDQTTEQRMATDKKFYLLHEEFHIRQKLLMEMFDTKEKTDKA